VKGLAIFLVPCVLMRFDRQPISKSTWIIGSAGSGRQKQQPVIDSVLIPGDPERETELQRRKEGIPLHAAVVADLKALAQRFDLSF
jgi:L-2-hydroxycarboxylate dehydrogenase (NAD+)